MRASSLIAVGVSPGQIINESVSFAALCPGVDLTDSSLP